MLVSAQINEKLVLNGSVWTFERIARTRYDLHKDGINSGTSYVELLLEISSL